MSATDALPRVRAWQPTDLGIPGPTSWDMARQFRAIRADPLSYLTEVSAQYGDLVSFPVPGPPALLVNDPAAARQVLQTAARTWGKQTVQYAALARVTGSGLLASSEPSWIDHRRLAAPAFHHERLLRVSDQVRAAAADAIAARLGHVGGGSGEVLDVATLTHTIGLDTVGRALFSADLTEQSQLLLSATSDAAALVVRLGRAVLPTAAWTPTLLNARLRSARRRLDAGAAAIISRRRAQVGRSAVTAPVGGHGDDLLGLLLDSGLPDDQVRDELVTMIIAGHETVAAALAWTLMLLAENPSVQDRVRTELAGRPGDVTLLDQRDQLPSTRSVIDESLRLFPPAWVVSRRAHQADSVAGHQVPAGTLVIISPWLMHRRAGSWTEPETFRPERFLDDSGRSDAYLPFGMGPRLCIGRELALGEMTIVLAELLRDHRVVLPPGWTRPRPAAQVAVHPQGGMPLLVTRTTGAAA